MRRGLAVADHAAAPAQDRRARAVGATAVEDDDRGRTPVLSATRTSIGRAQPWPSQPATTGGGRPATAMTAVWRTPPQVPARMVFLRCGKDNVILTSSPGPLNVADDDGDILLHTAFAVDTDQFDASVAELQKHGVKVVLEEEREAGVFVGRSAYFHDPDRNVLEIIDLEHAAFRPMDLTYVVRERKVGV